MSNLYKKVEESKNGGMVYLFQEVWGIDIESAAPFYNFHGAIVTEVFGHDLTAQEHGNHLTRRKALFVCLQFNFNSINVLVYSNLLFIKVYYQ